MLLSRNATCREHALLKCRLRESRGQHTAVHLSVCAASFIACRKFKFLLQVLCGMHNLQCQFEVRRSRSQGVVKIRPEKRHSNVGEQTAM